MAGILLIGLLVATGGAGQATQPNRGSVRGTVSNTEGQSLSAVVVRVPSVGVYAMTAEEGTYQVSGLPSGRYAIEFERIGYDPAVREVTVAAGGTARMDVTMSVCAIALAELVVTGTPGARDPLAVAADVDAVSGETLRSMRDASLGATLARTVPGVSSIETGSQAGIPVLRGLSGTRVRILQNGIGQEFYQYGVRHHPPTSLAEAERVEVVRGAASILYGSDALGGAVNVLTRRLPSAPEGRLHVGGEAETQLFSNNGEVAGLLDVHAAWSRFGVRAGLETRHGGDIQTPDQPDFFQKTAAGTARTGMYGDPKYTGELPYTGFDQWSTYGQVGVRGPFGVVEAVVTHWDDENNYLLPSGGPKGSLENPPVGVGLHLAQTNVTLKGSLTGDRVVVRPTLSYQRALRQALPSGCVIGDGSDYEVDLQKDVLTSRLEVAHEGGGRLGGTVGAELVHHDGKTRGPVALEPGATVTSLGVFAFEETKLGRLTLSMGARFDHRRQEAKANLLTSDPDLLASSYSVFSGSVGGVYRLGEGWALAANATSGFRAPTVFELFANGEHGGVAAYQRGDPELGPERSLGMDVSLRAHSGRLRGEINGYRTLIRNYIYLKNTGEETGQGLPIYQAGQTDASILGVDGTVESDVLGWLAVGGHFSALRGTGDDIAAGGGRRGGPLPLLPPTEMGGFVRFHGSQLGPVLAPAFRVDIHHARAKDAAGVIEPFSQFDLIPFGTASTEAYTLIDMEARMVVETGPAQISVTLTATNLLDTAYRAFLDTYKGYTLSMGRNVGLRVSAPLEFPPLNAGGRNGGVGMNAITYHPIGVIRTPFMDVEGVPIQPVGALGVRGTVELDPVYLEGLQDLEGFSHIFLLYHLDRVKTWTAKVVPFMDDHPHGVFATRAPARPNAIGISVVRLTKAEGATLQVEDVDMLDRTPLLDIKPYLPEFDCREVEGRGWLEENAAKARRTRSDDRFR